MSNPRKLVNEQAEDEALWFDATGASEAYLQREIRKLHDAVEHDLAMAVVDAAMAVHNFKILGDKFYRDEYEVKLAILEGTLDQACRKYAEEVEHE